MRQLRHIALGIADIADVGLHHAASRCAKLLGDFLQDLLAASADAERCAQLEKSAAHALAQAGGSAGDQDFFGGK